MICYSDWIAAQKEDWSTDDKTTSKCKSKDDTPFKPRKHKQMSSPPDGALVYVIDEDNEDNNAPLPSSALTTSTAAMLVTAPASSKANTIPSETTRSLDAQCHDPLLDFWASPPSTPPPQSTHQYPLPLQPHLPRVPTNAPLTCPNLCSLMVPILANSNTSPANPDSLLAKLNVFPAGPDTSPSPPEPLEPPNSVSDPSIHH
ncbi:hypothetical protein H2248_001176 [Termitomyces sp. 'cryptogamus']|nr:hypothetical protein H2248_001176 [Termitomyces sp. 'cryptogamus']